MKTKQLFCFACGLFLSFIALFTACSEKIYLQSHWKPRFVDSLPNDSFLLESESQLLYKVMNDSANVYLLVRIIDKQQQMRIVHEGLTVWLNLNGKTSKKYGIKYPTSLGLPDEREKVTMNNNKEQRFQFMLNSSELTLLGFDDEGSEEVLTANNCCDVRAKILPRADGTLDYSLTIPIRRIKLLIKESSKAQLSLGVEMSESQRIHKMGDREFGEEGSGMGGRRSGGMGGGMQGGMGGGGMHGGGGSQMNGGGRRGETTQPGPNTTLKKIDFWIQNIQLKKYKL